MGTCSDSAVCLLPACLPVTDASGFLLINEFLQSAGGPPEVFAVGDVASSVTHPRPKAGVYAVRQVGPRPHAAALKPVRDGGSIFYHTCQILVEPTISSA